MLSLYLSMVETDEQRTFIEELYKNYESKMYGVAFGILHNKHDAEDAVHSAFIRIIDNIDKFMQIDLPKLKSLIVIIVRNISLDILKKESHTVPMEDEHIDALNADDFNEFSVSEKVEVMNAIKSLPEIQQHIITLFYIDGFTAEETAGMLDISKWSVYKHIASARENLKRELNNE